MKRLLLTLGLLLSTTLRRMQNHRNPITDISWKCIFPMRIAGVKIVGGAGRPF